MSTASTSIRSPAEAPAHAPVSRRTRHPDGAEAVPGHCLRAYCAGAIKAGDRGIKALVIYPMNALATDQARRFAEVIASTPAFAGLRVGLFVGGHLGQPGSGMVMSSTNVITDRETMRKTPPDVLLTNYKMLDYLLLRPKDRQLWARNTPETLRYVVVDELHTFDGAQGTDLALLLRRLRARLQVPEGRLVCVGTSATLGVFPIPSGRPRRCRQCVQRHRRR